MTRPASRGSALAFALALFPLLLVLGLAFMSLSGCDYGFSGRAAMRVRAYYLADAGARYAYLERARWRREHTETLTLQTGDVRILVQPGSNGWTRIVAVGRAGSTTTRIEARVDYLGRIQAWIETAGSWSDIP